MNRKPFKTLSTKGKIKYLLTSGLAEVFLGTVLILLVCAWIWEDFIRGKPVLQIEMINGCTASMNDQTFRPFLDQAGYPADDGEVRVSSVIQMSSTPAGPCCNPYQLLVCSISAERTDLYFWDTDTLDPVLMEASLMDLREVLPRDILEKYRDQLIYTGLQLHGGYPCGILLEGNTWLEETQCYEKCAVGICESSERADTAADFLKFILD